MKIKNVFQKLFMVLGVSVLYPIMTMIYLLLIIYSIITMKRGEYDNLYS